MIVHKCGKKGHLKREGRSKGNDYSGNPSNKYINYLPEWVTNKTVVSDTKTLATDTTTLKYSK